MTTNGSMCLDEKKKRSREVVAEDRTTRSRKEADRPKSPRLLDDDEFQNAAPTQDQLVEELKAEIGKLQERVSELEKQVEEKAELEVAVQVMEEQIDEFTGRIESLEDLNQVLTIKELQHYYELQETHKLLIQEIGESSSNSQCPIGIKRMGELDSKPFCDALKDICDSSSEDRFSDQSVLLCNFWEQMLKDPLWHPFKITLVDGKYQELIDEEDKLLKGLKNAWGEEAYYTVVNALLELNEHNPNGRYPVQELWNFEENRRATLNEGVAALAHRLRMYPNGRHPVNWNLEENRRATVNEGVAELAHGSRMYHPNGRHSVQELWTFVENRRDTMNEGVAELGHHLRMYHRTSTTTTGKNSEKSGTEV